MRPTTLLTLLTLAGWCSPAAADTQQAVLACTQIGDPAARLACYDRATGTETPPAEKAAIDLSESARASFEHGKAELIFTPTGQTAAAGDTATDATAYTPLSLAFDLDRNHDSGILSARPHRPIYLLPGWFNSSPNRYPSSPEHRADQSDQNHAETKMQISFKTKLMEDVFGTHADLWFGYTQISHWQVYNGSMSSPFRNTDYEPEFILTQPVKADLPFGGRLRMLGVGAVHQSNGQSDPLSRSWNRLYLMGGMEWGKLTVLPRLWWRIPESRREDDNSNINRYMGYGDLRLHYRFDDRQTLGALMRYNPASGKGGVQLDYTFPLAGRLKGYLQGFHGYGESLLDYNHKHNSIGIGVMLNDWDGL
ncbi:phospholipase A [Neisseria shayeganii]|uniref:Phospholipase A1 n=1 Tax=Neisseria shayeganii TaxID=607712 RepID=A0A7D7N5U9_9NEIS|nr:phospholipase A [Neisseria shayeganii]QMT39441.1 phospholipase A [Neisseria shayeganii]